MNKDIFLKIPDAPNYEVNGHYVVRNCNTKNVRKPRPDGYIDITYHGGAVRATASSFYARALAVFDAEDWHPVPSLDGRYELDRNGNLRNATNKKLLRRRRTSYQAFSNGKYRPVSVNRLLHEVYGIELPPESTFVPVIVSKDGESYSFESKTACARFLSGRVFYSVGYIVTMLKSRPRELFGWAVRFP